MIERTDFGKKLFIGVSGEKIIYFLGRLHWLKMSKVAGQISIEGPEWIFFSEHQFNLT